MIQRWPRNGRFATTLFNVTVAIVGVLSGCPAQAQSNCPSGINLRVNSGDEMIAIWSPLSYGDYFISRGWNYGTHTGKDRYALDLNMAGTTDLGRAVFAPITGRIFRSYYNGYGNTVLLWDPGSGIVVRGAHEQSVSSTVNRAGQGDWLGAGEKIGYIGETGCPGCGPHFHLAAYRNVLVGTWYNNHSVTEAEIVQLLSAGQIPSFAEPQKFRIIAPSDNCDLIRFSDSATVYTQSGGILYPVTFDVWRSWGLSINLHISPNSGNQDGTYDDTAGAIPIRVLPDYQRPWYNISTQMAWPRRESVFKGEQYPDTYVFRWGQKYLLNANQFGEGTFDDYRWTEIQVMSQNFVDQLAPTTSRGATGATDPLATVRADCQWQAAQFSWMGSKQGDNVTQVMDDSSYVYRSMSWNTAWGNGAVIYHATDKGMPNIRWTAIWVGDWQYWTGWTRVNR